MLHLAEMFESLPSKGVSNVKQFPDVSYSKHSNLNFFKARFSITIILVSKYFDFPEG